jgi:hypothetical protein
MHRYQPKRATASYLHKWIYCNAAQKDKLISTSVRSGWNNQFETRKSDGFRVNRPEHLTPNITDRLMNKFGQFSPDFSLSHCPESLDIEQR